MGNEMHAKFNGIGFHTWQTRVRGYLMKKNLWGVVKPLAEGESMQTRAQLAQFTSKDEQALGIILTALDDNFIHNLDDAQTAQAAWNIRKIVWCTCKAFKNDTQNSALWLNVRKRRRFVFVN